MADLFTRLVSGPAASSAPLAPRVPTLHEPPPIESEEALLAPMSLPEPEPRATAAAAARDVFVHREVLAAVPPSPGEPRDLGGFVSPGQHKSAKISPELRPRETPEVRGPFEPRETRGALEMRGALEPREVREGREPQASREREPTSPPHRSRTAQRGGREERRPEPNRTTVRIEIGRIEIRAPQTPAPAPAFQAETRPEAGLSLADYLRGNDGRPR